MEQELQKRKDRKCEWYSILHSIILIAMKTVPAWMFYVSLSPLVPFYKELIPSTVFSNWQNTKTLTFLQFTIFFSDRQTYFEVCLSGSRLGEAVHTLQPFIYHCYVLLLIICPLLIKVSTAVVWADSLWENLGNRCFTCAAVLLLLLSQNWKQKKQKT